MKILFVTAFSSDDLCGGAAIVRQLVAGASEHQIRWVSLARPKGFVPVELPHVTTEFKWLNTRGNVRFRLQKAWRWFFRKIWCPRLAKRLFRESQHDGVDLMWIVYDFGLAPFLETWLKLGPERRLHVTLHDDPVDCARREGDSEAFIDCVRRTSALLKTHLHLTADSVTDGLAHDVLGPAVVPVLATLGVDPLKSSPLKRLASPLRHIRLGYSGNFYGRQEMEALIAGWRRWSEQTGGSWELLVYGDASLAALDDRITAHGPTPPAEVQRGLGECDCLLLPTPLNRPEAMTNLPTKLVSYSELGLPVLAVSLEGSETTKLLNLACLGPVAITSSPEAIDAAIVSLLHWDWTAAEVGLEWLRSWRFAKSRIKDDLSRAFALP